MSKEIKGRFDPRTMSQEEICKVWDWKCQHGHRGTVHYNCYLKAKGKTDRIGFIDIEATNLKADFGIVISYCIKDSDSRKIDFDCITKKDLADGVLDKRVLQSFLEDIQKYDKVVHHFGQYFDLPFLRTRCLQVGLDFPEYGALKSQDTWKMAKNTLCLSSNRLENISRIIIGKTNKTRINGDIWLKALQGDKKSLDYILDHNKKDVIDLEKIYNKLKKFQPKSNRSI